MRTFVYFVRNAAWWSAGLLVMLLGVSVLTGQTAQEVGSNILVWAGLAIVLSALPAGISVSGRVFPNSNGLNTGNAGGFAAGVITLTLATALLVSVASRPGRDAAEPATLTLSELRDAARASADETVATVGIDDLSLEWRETNILVWHYARRLAAIAQPALFALTGVLLGFWGARLSERRLELTGYWAVGFFLVVSTYLAGENSFELIVLQAAGPVFFAGLFVLIVPPVLILGLGIPTLIELLPGQRDAPP